MVFNKLPFPQVQNQLNVSWMLQLFVGSHHLLNHIKRLLVNWLNQEGFIFWRQLL